MENETLLRLKKVEANYNKLKFGFFLLLFGFIGATIYLLLKPAIIPDVIYTRGIVITDSTGRQRILIGAPVPYSKDRVRTDTNLVRKYWAGNFANPSKYMNWYKSYKNSAEGIVFMNEKGFDVVQIGNNLSDPNTGQRMFKCNGMIWNTQEGWERGGAGVNTTSDGQSRSVIGIDDEQGEAIHMVCLEDGGKGIIVSGEQGSLRIGFDKKDGMLFQDKNKFTGMRFFDNNGKILWQQIFTEELEKGSK